MNATIGQSALVDACGNRFIVVEADPEDRPPALPPAAIADGVILAKRTSDGLRCRVINLDGGDGGVSGNGARCVAAFFELERDMIRFPERDMPIQRIGPTAWEVRMGEAVVRDVSVALEWPAEATPIAEVFIGNPHIIVRGRMTEDDFQTLGRRMQTAVRSGVNLQWIVDLHPEAISLRSWERGVGPTRACGSGACATVAACFARGLLDVAHTITVRSPGGELTVRLDGRAMRLGGPARVLRRGAWDAIVAPPE